MQVEPSAFCVVRKAPNCSVAAGTFGVSVGEGRTVAVPVVVAVETAALVAVAVDFGIVVVAEAVAVGLVRGGEAVGVLEMAAILAVGGAVGDGDGVRLGVFRGIGVGSKWAVGVNVGRGVFVAKTGTSEELSTGGAVLCASGGLALGVDRRHANKNTAKPAQIAQRFEFDDCHFCDVMVLTDPNCIHSVCPLRQTIFAENKIPA